MAVVFPFTAPAKEPANVANTCYPIRQILHHAQASYAIPLPRQAATPDPHLTLLREAVPSVTHSPAQMKPSAM